MEGYITIPQAAKELGVRRSGLNLAIKRGRLKVEDAGTVFLVHVDEVKRYREEQLGKPGPKKLSI